MSREVLPPLLLSGRVCIELGLFPPCMIVFTSGAAGSRVSWLESFKCGFHFFNKYVIFRLSILSWVGYEVKKKRYTQLPTPPLCLTSGKALELPKPWFPQVSSPFIFNGIHLMISIYNSILILATFNNHYAKFLTMQPSARAGSWTCCLPCLLGPNPNAARPQPSSARDRRFRSSPSAEALGLSASNPGQSDLPASSQTQSGRCSDWLSLATVLGPGVESAPSGPER